MGFICAGVMAVTTIMFSAATTAAVVASPSPLLTAVKVSSLEPMVAFMCNMPAMHMTEDGWRKDDSTDCITEPQEILNYCHKLYPSLDVRNVVKASGDVIIKDWCPVGRARCHHRSHAVRPYRCLVGPFQSDALLVPRTCLFDHIHDPLSCLSYDAWNQSAIAACAGRGLVQQSFAIIQPCAVNRFSGAEFVCCPASTTEDIAANLEQNEDDDEDEDDVHDLASSSPLPPVVRRAKSFSTSTVSSLPSMPEFHDVIDPTSAAGVPVVSNNEYEKYMKQQQPAGAEKTEHELYKEAMKDLQTRHRQKVAKMMTEWTAARQRVQEMKQVDEKGADKLNRQITARFQKMYESLEREGETETKQLTAVHQQRVQTELNEQKRRAMEIYMQSLSDEEPNAVKVVKALKHYIKVEQKDRVHTISHYQHLERADSVQAEASFSYVADHLRAIDQRLAQALDMLDRLPKHKKKIRQHIDEFLSSYHSLDESLAVILAKMAERSSTSTSATSTIGINLLAETNQASAMGLSSDMNSDKENVKSEDLMQSSTLATKSGEAVVTFSVANQQEVVVDHVIRPASQSVHVVNGHVAHVGASKLEEHQSNAIHKQPVSTHKDKVQTEGVYLTTPLGITTCSIALVIIIAIGIIVLRKRIRSATERSEDVLPSRSCKPSGRAPSSSDASASPARPLATGQINGYENPTHKFLERREIEA